MDVSIIERPQASSTPFLSHECHEPLAKRPKLETSNSSNPNNPSIVSVPNSETENKCLKTELMTLRVRLSESEATVTQLHRIRREIEEIFDKERIMLQLQIKVDKELIDQLQVDLDKAVRSAHEALEAKTSAEAAMSQMVIGMEEKFSELLKENTRLKESIPSNSEEFPESLEDTESLQKLRIAETKILELEDKLEESIISQKEFELLSAELNYVTNQKIKIEKTAILEKKAVLTRMQELEDELQSSQNTISNLREVVKKMGLLQEKKLENTETVEKQVVKLQQNGDKSSASPDEMRCPQEEKEVREIHKLQKEPDGRQDAMKNKGSDLKLTDDGSTYSDDDDSSCKVSDRYESSSGSQPDDIDTKMEIAMSESGTKSVEIMVGNHSILVSDEKFFEVDWQDEYMDNGDEYSCMRCPLARRDSITQHMMECHAHLIQFG
ncbi:WEB family protein At5g16730, chloroplastic isoform X2 [Diachasma alloeum]|uniref:WEB family protein At5g16730, chloroplastic isoform X2 n=1 Tax=Diachasma alloeum TaxID=454923 RepID=UPI00073823E7|nr:WEB family protein At5g16730, chloroplastic isoform X2 [Diachasma alloeum]